ncbi:protein of unknown function [Candidatus Nitrosocosmicus franklandus]|uniref:Uncharacterized protein n=1 Tax=Candidatus Nitrosocosmicus franklandianus TaxID=1798806 RepID=A0A484IDE4_9ARCH|nr:protein of unknown function [Candidatus Nitrosocosmicus franklandus]
MDLAVRVLRTLLQSLLGFIEILRKDINNNAEFYNADNYVKRKKIT